MLSQIKPKLKSETYFITLPFILIFQIDVRYIKIFNIPW